MKKDHDYRYTQNRELSWLRFNQRILSEAKAASTPLMERVKFAEIFTNNLDEFFMVRVGSLSDLKLMTQEHIDNKTGATPQQQLDDIFEACIPLYRQRDKIYSTLEGSMRTCNIVRFNPDELEGKAKKQVDKWFNNSVLPLLSPQVIDMHHPFPHLPNKSLNVFLTIETEAGRVFGIIPLPQNMPRLFRIDEPGIHYVLLEDVLLAYAERVFRNITISHRSIISITRNADNAPEDENYEVDDDYRQLMKKVIKKRTRLAPVRLEIQGEQDQLLEDFLCEELELTHEQVFYSKTPLKLNYIYSLIDMLTPESRAALCNPEYTPRRPISLHQGEKIIPQILKRDVILFYPYDSMEPFLQLIKEAAGDPNVRSIRITIYRLAAKAKLVEYLCAAAEAGKEVTVIMELRARFDEQANIRWAERMEDAGCTVLYGQMGIKVHSKLCQITRMEKGKLQYITQVGTGNYNEKTAKIYTDLSLMTADPVIGADATALFQNVAMGNMQGKYDKLIASPFMLRDKVIELIDEQIALGSEGYIFLKLNSITDRQIMDKLAEASCAGVQIDMNIRGICCILPGIPGLTENIRVFSVVGQYLEHARIYCFGRDRETAKLYIASADFMTRNTEKRVEVGCPVQSEQTRKRVFAIIDEFMADNGMARTMDADGSYRRIKTSEMERKCQLRFMQDAIDEAPPVEVKRPSLKKKILKWLIAKLED